MKAPSFLEWAVDQAVRDGDRRDRADNDAREDHPDETVDPVLNAPLRPVFGILVGTGQGLLLRLPPLAEHSPTSPVPVLLARRLS